MADPAINHAGPAAGAAVQPGMPAAQGMGAESVPPSFSTTGTCATMSAMDSVCSPQPGPAPLAAPLPGMAPFPAAARGTAAPRSDGYGYLPCGPSPCDLSISRT